MEYQHNNEEKRIVVGECLTLGTSELKAGQVATHRSGVLSKRGVSIGVNWGPVW